MKMFLTLRNVKIILTIIFLVSAIVIFFISYQIRSRAAGQCELNYLEKDENFPYDYEGFAIIGNVGIKAGTACTVLSGDGDNGCYKVEGLETSAVKVRRIGTGPDCKEISYVSYYRSEISPSATPAVTITPQTTEVPQPSQTPAATNTPIPTNTPTRTPAPTKTPTPQPTNTPTPATTLTPQPTNTPTKTPIPTKTPTPTETEIAYNSPTPQVSNTPGPSATQGPSATTTPGPSATSQPGPSATPTRGPSATPTEIIVAVNITSTSGPSKAAGPTIPSVGTPIAWFLVFIPVLLLVLGLVL